MGDDMQISKKRGLTLLQYRADTDKRIQALEDGLKGLVGALDDVRAEVASATAEQAEKLESAEQTASDRIIELEARAASLEKLDRDREAKYERAKATVGELCDLVDVMRLELDLATRPWWRKLADRIFGAE